jgi:ESCRT-II complex subunit VPS36
LTSHRLFMEGLGSIQCLYISLIKRIESKTALIGSSKLTLYLTSNDRITGRTPWKCTICETDNLGEAEKCALCGVKPRRQHASWTCPACTFQNVESVDECQVCGGVKGVQGGQSQMDAIKLSFTSSSALNKFKGLLEEALINKAWEGKSMETGTFVGVSGVVKRSEELQSKQQEALSDAFQSIDQLVSKASEMVKLSETIMAQLKAKEQVTQGERDEFKMIVSTLGLTSIVTRDSAGQAYEHELAKQLADVAMKLMRLKKVDILTVTDLFCFYNRTRGTALCSPKDCIAAIQDYWPVLKVPVMCRMFGRVLVVQSPSHSDEQMMAKIKETVRVECITAMKWAERNGVPLVIATEQLLQAEGSGLLARDESLSGVTFYQNDILHL